MLSLHPPRPVHPRSKPPHWLSRLVLSWSLISLAALKILVAPIHAADTQTITLSNNKVSASVPDHTKPSAPILVSPADGSYVTTQLPPLTWQPSTDDVGVNHYQLTIDGSTLLSSISTTATENSSYKLVINSDSSLTLTLKTSLSEGQHTWKVTAVDAAGNSETSATWSFTIDSQAPNFVLTHIGATAVSISAQDSSTWPSTVLTTTSNPAQLTATTEALSKVTVTVSWGGQSHQTLTSSADSNGNWSATLGIVPRDTEITLDFVVVDHVGLTTVLEGVRFKVPSGTSSPSPTAPRKAGVPTITPEPSGSFPELTVTPVANPADPSPTPTTTPQPFAGITFSWNWPGGQGTTLNPGLGSPLTSLPAVQELLLTVSAYLPASLSQPIQNVLTTPASAQPWWWSSAALLAWLGLIGIAWLWWLANWGQAWLKAGWPRWWQVLNSAHPWFAWFKWEQPQGLVLSHSGLFQPLKLAKISLFAATPANSEPIELETLFTDQTGQFHLPTWPPSALTGPAGQYSLSITAYKNQLPLSFVPNPVNWPNPFNAFVYLHHQYRGGWLSLRKDLPFPSLIALVTADTTAETWTQKLSVQVGSHLTGSARLDSGWWVPWFSVAFLAASLWGGWLNWILVLHFGLTGISKVANRFRLKAWQLVPSTPVSQGQPDWVIITSKAFPAQAWWSKAQQSSIQLPKELKMVIATVIDPMLTRNHPQATRSSQSPAKYKAGQNLDSNLLVSDLA